MSKNLFFFKKYKLNQLQKIKKTFKYIYFFRYNDFNNNEIISLKKIIKKLNYKSLILNKNSIVQIFPKLRGQGSILIIYGDKSLNFLNDLNHLKKLNLIYLIIQNNIFSSFKIKKILTQNYLPFNNLLVSPFLNFIYYLRKI